MSQDDTVRQLATWVAGQLAAGRSKADVEKELTGAGVSPDVARNLVATVDSHYRGARAKSTVLGWVYVIVVFIALNGILYGIQEIAAADDKRAVRELEVTMTNWEREINAIESRARAFGGVTPEEAKRYEWLVQQFNANVPTYNELAKKAYSRWWLLPIPLPRGAGRAALRSGQ